MKMIKRIMAVVCAFAFSICFSLQVSAASGFDYEGISYIMVTNQYVSITGWDNRSSELIIPDSINGRYTMSIGNYALSGNTEITSVDFSDVAHLERIGMGAFQSCTNINQELILPTCLETINDCAFQECSLLPSVVDNSQIKEIPDQCFYKCSSLQAVQLNDDLERIGYYAFADCPQLQRVDIPKSVATIGKSSFQNDPNLTLGVWYGSYGYEYAKAQNIPYILLDNAFLGDANGDGYVNVNDVTAIQRHAAELEPLEGICFHAADIDGDGDVSVDDATELQRFLAEYAVDYPIGEVMTQ